jgi:ATP-binding protein involved in chromosome partitioning
MSYFVCSNCSERHEIFGHGGGEALAERFEVPFLGAIPLSMSVREGGDLGIPIVVGAPDSPQAAGFRQVAQNIAAQVSIAAIKANKALPVLNVKQ